MSHDHYWPMAWPPRLYILQNTSREGGEEKILRIWGKQFEIVQNCVFEPKFEGDSFHAAGEKIKCWGRVYTHDYHWLYWPLSPRDDMLCDLLLCLSLSDNSFWRSSWCWCSWTSLTMSAWSVSPSGLDCQHRIQKTIWERKYNTELCPQLWKL